MKVKNIIHVSSYYPPHLGGQENAVYDLTRQLANAGNRVQVITSSKGSNPGKTLEGQVLVTRLFGFVFGHAPIMPKLLSMLLRIASPNSIVHLHVGQAFTPEVVWLASKIGKFKYVAQLHIDFEPSGPAGFLLPLYKKFILKHVLNSASAVVTLNQQALDTVRSSYRYQGPAQVMNNGIDDSYFTLMRQPFPANPPKTLKLLFVGRLSKQKNIPALLKALTLTKRNVHLDIIGDGDEKEAIIKKIQELGLQNVTFHGQLGREEVAKFYETHDALIMPSLYEAQPLVLLEAMAARIPIIGTNVIGVEEHIHGAGIVVEPTPQGIATGIDRYYTEYDQLPQLTENAYQFAEELNWLNTLEKYESLYEEVLET